MCAFSNLRVRQNKFLVFQAIDNPVCAEIRDVCAAAGLTLGVEVSFKTFPFLYRHLIEVLYKLFIKILCP